MKTKHCVILTNKNRTVLLRTKNILHVEKEKKKMRIYIYTKNEKA